MTNYQKLKKWAEENKSLYFFLPDGPYGRPFDNQYTIKSIYVNNNQLDISFFEDIYMSFYGNIAFEFSDAEVKIKNFNKFTFKDGDDFLKDYLSGEVNICCILS